jgi:hypothetical protein
VTALACARLLRDVAVAAEAAAALGAVMALMAAVSANPRPADVYAAAVCVGRWAEIKAALHQAVCGEARAAAAVEEERVRARVVHTKVATATATASSGSEAAILERLGRVDLR